MNCRNFALIVGDLVRSELPERVALMEVKVAEEARTHATECGRCQMRLMNEGALLNGLKALAAADKKKESLVDEGKLRSAFRESFAAFAQNGDAPVEVGSKRLDSAKPVWWGFAVAACLIVALGSTWVLWSRDKESPISEVRVGPVSTPSQPILASEREKPSKGLIQGPVEVIQSGVGVQKPRLVARRVTARVTDSSYVDVSLGEFQPVTAEPEEATEFFQMAQNSDGPMTSGQVVRVVMPRSAMSYFGLPLNVDRMNERVKADVLLGEDGLARAIRFVR